MPTTLRVARDEHLLPANRRLGVWQLRAIEERAPPAFRVGVTQRHHRRRDAIERALGPLPIVAEDLGFITPDVTELRDACGFPGMKILQFAFGGDGTHEFLPHTYGPAYVVYSGTHDNDTARGWWDNAPEHERRFAGTYLACGAHDVHWGMIRAACNSVANIAVFPMVLVERQGGFELVALFGLQNGQNLFVDPQGRWMARYIPARLRSYPFSLAFREGMPDPLLCVDESSRLIGEVGDDVVGGDDVREELDDGDVGPEALMMCLIIFLWTPPHFWALALYRVEDYRKSGLPMLPVTHGSAFTRLNVLLYTLVLFAGTLLPFITGMSGWLYLVSAVVLGVWFIVYAYQLWRHYSDALSRATFRFSILYLSLLFAALLLDHYLMPWLS